ncbi:hypothetical protein SAMN02745130_01170 [Thiothrix eikelboomii]|uniref:Uncharacterized protein n=1 Tax=Thiothrix eikelboomii TaxID=92487 RepID=A0A1T4W7X5_9GAMM|nr:hypothetical protein SAMN02745130_01170 [Thiothrix eikelboomii]
MLFGRTDVAFTDEFIFLVSTDAEFVAVVTFAVFLRPACLSILLATLRRIGIPMPRPTGCTGVAIPRFVPSVPLDRADGLSSLVTGAWGDVVDFCCQGDKVDVLVQRG